MLYVSFLAYYCAHCPFEKLMLILALIHALPTRGRKCASSSWEMHFVTRKRVFYQGGEKDGY
jgi:hypothetical protein